MIFLYYLDKLTLTNIIIFSKSVQICKYCKMFKLQKHYCTLLL